MSSQKVRKMKITSYLEEEQQEILYSLKNDYLREFHLQNYCLVVVTCGIELCLDPRISFEVFLSQVKIENPKALCAYLTAYFILSRLTTMEGIFKLPLQEDVQITSVKLQRNESQKFWSLIAKECGYEELNGLSLKEFVPQIRDRYITLKQFLPKSA